MRTHVTGMATDLLPVHRILSTLWELKGLTVTRDTKSRDTIHKIANFLVKASKQKLLCTLEELMDKHSKQDSQEFVRRTIMEHDKVFRQQVHELHRLYHVQKSLMAELGCENHSYQSRTEEIHEMVQESRSNLKSSPCTSETNQSARSVIVNARHSTPQQVPEHLSFQECEPGTCLSLFGEENSTVKEEFHTEKLADKCKSIEGENLSASVESDLDLKLSIGPSSHSSKAPHWLFSGSRERNPSGQHR